jgi:glycosyltransferase involved in cell wall biosynthesis
MLNFSWRVYRDLCRRAKPDAIIGSSPNLFAALAAERAAAHHRVPFVFEIRDIWPQTLVDMTGSAGLTARVLQAMANFLYRRADHLVTLAKGTNRHLEDLGIAAAKITYIPNGIVAENFPVLDDHDRRRIRGSYGLPEQDFLCVYAGAHGRANGLDNVLNTALLLQDHPDIGFVLVGDGPSKQDLLAQAKRDGLKNVYFHDPVPKTDIPALLGSMDLGLLILQNVEVFKYGISPNKLFDYWAARLPVIATTPGEIGDLIETAKGGKQIAAEDAGALSQAVSEAASHPEHYRDMGLQGHHFVTEHFERTKLAQSLAMVLENCRGNRP